MEIGNALGKHRVPDGLEATIALEQFLKLPARIAHTAALHHLPAPHRDPFDRLLGAQAQVDRLSVVTADPVFDRYQVPTISAEAAPRSGMPPMAPNS